MIRELDQKLKQASQQLQAATHLRTEVDTLSLQLGHEQGIAMDLQVSK